MKKAIIRTVAILIIATLIAGPSASATSTTAATEVHNPVALFPLTLTPEELLVVLKEHNIKILTDEPADYGEDGRIYNYDSSFWYQCEGISFSFTEDEKMRYFNVKSDRFATPEGICVGDSRLKVTRKYGVIDKLIGMILDFFGLFFGKAGYDAKTKDGYYRFSLAAKIKYAGHWILGFFYKDGNFRVF